MLRVIQPRGIHRFALSAVENRPSPRRAAPSSAPASREVPQIFMSLDYRFAHSCFVIARIDGTL
jgi:hypothetical protein